MGECIVIKKYVSLYLIVTAEQVSSSSDVMPCNQDVSGSCHCQDTDCPDWG
jgi:hypothetical protein